MLERSVGGDDDVVCDESDGEGNEEWVEQSCSTATHFLRFREREQRAVQSRRLSLLLLLSSCW